MHTCYTRVHPPPTEALAALCPSQQCLCSPVMCWPHMLLQLSLLCEQNMFAFLKCILHSYVFHDEIKIGRSFMCKYYCSVQKSLELPLKIEIYAKALLISSLIILCFPKHYHCPASDVTSPSEKDLPFLRLYCMLCGFWSPRS